MKIIRLTCLFFLAVIVFPVVIAGLIEPVWANEDCDREPIDPKHMRKIIQNNLLEETNRMVTIKNFEGETINLFFPETETGFNELSSVNDTIAAEEITSSKTNPALNVPPAFFQFITNNMGNENPIVVYGDINGDNVVNVGDAILVLRHIVGLVNLEEEYGFEVVERLLTDREDPLNVSHAIRLLRYVVGLEPALKITGIFHESTLAGSYVNLKLSILGSFNANELEVLINEDPLDLIYISKKILGVEVPHGVSGNIRVYMGELSSNSFYFSPLRDNDSAHVEEEIARVINDLSAALEAEDIPQAITFFSPIAREEYEGILLGILEHKPDILKEMAIELQGAQISLLTGIGELYDTDSRIAELKIDLDGTAYFPIFVLEDDLWLLETF